MLITRPDLNTLMLVRCRNLLKELLAAVRIRHSIIRSVMDGHRTCDQMRLCCEIVNPVQDCESCADAYFALVRERVGVEFVLHPRVVGNVSLDGGGQRQASSEETEDMRDVLYRLIRPRLSRDRDHRCRYRYSR